MKISINIDDILSKYKDINKQSFIDSVEKYKNEDKPKYGELNHEHNTDNLLNISHQINKIELKENDIDFDIEILNKLPNGKIVEEMNNNDIQLTLKPRMTGYYNGEEYIVDKIISYDLCSI
jgi:hypothetical protein